MWYRCMDTTNLSESSCLNTVQCLHLRRLLRSALQAAASQGDLNTEAVALLLEHRADVKWLFLLDIQGLDLKRSGFRESFRGT